MPSQRVVIGVKYLRYQDATPRGRPSTNYWLIYGKPSLAKSCSKRAAAWKRKFRWRN